jgi:hypothetical protein
MYAQLEYRSGDAQEKSCISKNDVLLMLDIHSTVTLFAKFLGLSTSVPFTNAV